MLSAFFASNSGIAVYGVLVLAFVDFALGVMAAIRDKTFTLDVVAAYLRSHVVGRVFPITLLLAAGYFGNQDALTALGLVSAAAYLAETIGSISTSWGPGHATQAVPDD